MNKILTLLMLLFCMQLTTAAGTNPPPPPPPIGFPIDSGLVVLFFIALVMGSYLSKKYILIKKSS